MPAANSAVHVFGIRHHGPGSARTLLAALRKLKPDIILVEGPADAQAVLDLAARPDMKPPVALLVYDPAAPYRAAYFPFAHFSPEWQTIRYGFEQGIPVRLIDLPQAHRLAILAEQEALSETVSNEANAEDEAETTENEQVRHDPLGELAQAAGYDDSERWWEELIEHRRNGADLFEAVLEAMTAMREAMTTPADELGLLREAYMRQSLRAAMREGFERIAVVCGAWHAPVLLPDRLPPVSEDRALLKGLKKIKVVATWIPWTHGRLTTVGGYGAGIRSPGWYQYLWEAEGDIAAGWLTRVARLLRDEDQDASPAQVIDAVRMAETLAAMRRRALPGLEEFNEATLAVFCGGSDKPMQLIREKLIVGETMGHVPADTPLLPLQQDLLAEQKRLRLKAEPVVKVINLDLRKPTHLARSHLLHRLQLLNVPWGLKETSGGQGTFHEDWRLYWYPELALNLIEKSAWGNTILDAAAAFARHVADHAPDLPTLTGLVNTVLLADLPDAIDHVVNRLQAAAALTGDVARLLTALPALADLLSYGNVRQTDFSMVSAVVEGMVTRICIGLPAACVSLADEAAEEMFERLRQGQQALRLLRHPPYLAAWYGVLTGLLDQRGVHGLIRGRAARLLLDGGELSPAALIRHLQLALSPGLSPTAAAAWLTGFLHDSGLVLLHHETLLPLIDDWLMSLLPSDFQAMLPLLRRTFATFTEPERRKLGQRLQSFDTEAGRAAAKSAAQAEQDPARAEAMLPIIAELLGVNRL
jgi:hypothetical protein